MKEEYISDDQYKSYYSKLNGLRHRIACDLSVKPGMHILDLATGSGFFAIELAMLDSTLKIDGIDISKDGILNARIIVKAQGFSSQIKVTEMDATQMNFPNNYFDMVVNFTGLEDIHMTKGRTGIDKTFTEVSRVLKLNGLFCFVVMPPEQMETKAEQIEVAIFSYICDASWLSMKEYKKILDSTGFRLISTKEYRTGKKLTPEQAKEEIRYACDNVPKIYGIDTPSFQEVWYRFGEDIQRNGMGHYSKVILFIAKKRDMASQ